MTGPISRKIYRRILFLYPEPFRLEFGDEMVKMFEACSATQGYWRLLADVGGSAARQQIRYHSTPAPKSAPLYSKIASSPNLARILAVAGLGVVLIGGVLLGEGKPKASASWTLVRPPHQVCFPATTTKQYCFDTPLRKRSHARINHANQ